MTGGVHGAEYAGILGAIRVFEQLDPSELKGTVVVIPVCSPVAFSRITRYVCPIDNLNLNRVFPGNKEGSFTQRLASVIFENVVSRAQYAIDLHSEISGNGSSHTSSTTSPTTMRWTGPRE